MKKKFLALSVALALGGVASTANAAFTVTEGGIGHVLVTPYYTVQAGQHTLLNIVNTDTANAKAVKVRFRAALDSDDAYDFQVFLSPGDVWAADVQPTADGGVALFTSDNSCTLPANVGKDWTQSGGVWVPGANSAFVTDVAKGARLWSKDPIGVKEGYVEIFNMADIPRVLLDAAGEPTSTANPLWNTVKHDATGKPACDSATLLGIEAEQTSFGALTAHTDLVSYNYLSSDSKTASGATRTGLVYPGQHGHQLSAPSGSLFGNWIILNTTDASAYSAGMTTIVSDQNVAGENGTRIVYSQQTPDPVLAVDGLAGVTATAIGSFPGVNATADAVLLQGNKETATNAWNVLTVRTAEYDFPDLSTPYELDEVGPYDHAAALSLALLRTSTTGEFLTYKGGDVMTATDWVFSQPTRRYHVAGRGAKYIYGSETAAVSTFGTTTNGVVNGFVGATAPYHKLAAQSIAMTNYHADGHGACVLAGGFDWRNREELEPGFTAGGAVISPSLPSVPKALYLCNEVGVVAINPLLKNSVTDVLASPKTSVEIFSGLTAGAAVADPTVLNAGFKDSGWSVLNLSVSSNGGIGLPLVGSQFSKFVAGANAQGYGYNYNHRFTQSGAAITTLVNANVPVKQ